MQQYFRFILLIRLVETITLVFQAQKPNNTSKQVRLEKPEKKYSVYAQVVIKCWYTFIMASLHVSRLMCGSILIG